MPSSSLHPSTTSPIRQFLRSSVGAGVAVLARAVGALVLNKLFATWAPAGGLTRLAQFQNLMALLTTLPNDGTHVGVVKYLAPLRPGSPRYRLWLGAALGLNIAALLLGMSWLAVSGFLSWSHTLLFGLGIGLVTGQALLGAALLAAGRLRAYVSLSVALAGVGPGAAAAALAGGRPLEEVLLAYLLAQGATLLPALGLAAWAGLLRQLRPLGRVSPAAVRSLARFLLMAVSTLLFGKAVDYALRAHLLTAYGPARTDLWQAVAKLSDNYTMVFGAVMSSVFYPRLAALEGQGAVARRYVRSIAGLLAGALAAGLGLIFLGRDWLLPLLFAPRLLAARELLAPQLLGDWARFLSWIFLYQLMAQARTGRYVAVQAASAAVFGVLLVALLPAYGVAGALWANAARSGLLLVGCGICFWQQRR